MLPAGAATTPSKATIGVLADVHAGSEASARGSLVTFVALAGKLQVAAVQLAGIVKMSPVCVAPRPAVGVEDDQRAGEARLVEGPAGRLGEHLGARLRRRRGRHRGELEDPVGRRVAGRPSAARCRRSRSPATSGHPRPGRRRRTRRRRSRSAASLPVALPTSTAYWHAGWPSKVYFVQPCSTTHAAMRRVGRVGRGVEPGRGLCRARRVRPGRAEVAGVGDRALGDLAARASPGLPATRPLSSVQPNSSWPSAVTRGCDS